MKQITQHYFGTTATMAVMPFGKHMIGMALVEEPETIESMIHSLEDDEPDEGNTFCQFFGTGEHILFFHSRHAPWSTWTEADMQMANGLEVEEEDEPQLLDDLTYLPEEIEQKKTEIKCPHCECLIHHCETELYSVIDCGCTIMILPLREDLEDFWEAITVKGWRKMMGVARGELDRYYKALGTFGSAT